MRSLLDVNVLIALLDGAHLHHRICHEWLAGALTQGWASCPITQNGCIRILSQPAYPGALAAAQVAERLAEACRAPAHAFWPDDVNPLDTRALDWRRLLGHRQLTDAYLLALAVRHAGRFVTLDSRLDASIVPQAGPEHLVRLLGR